MTEQTMAPGESRAAAATAASAWWIFLVTGIAWILFSIIVFRFDYTSVSAISILFGIVMIGAAISELFAVFPARGWWKVAHGALSLAFLVIGIVSFVHPGDTFRALAAVMSFYFIIKGTFDLIVAIAAHGAHLWWLRLILGLVEIGIGFWAAGDFGNQTILLIVWVGLTALFRGIGEIILAFGLRGLQDQPA